MTVAAAVIAVALAAGNGEEPGGETAALAVAAQAFQRRQERAIAERNALVQAMFRRGVLILGAGKNAIRLAPPLVFTKDQADIVLEFLAGTRVNKDGQRAASSQVQAGWLFRF